MRVFLALLEALWRPLGGVPGRRAGLAERPADTRLPGTRAQLWPPPTAATGAVPKKESHGRDQRVEKCRRDFPRKVDRWRGWLCGRESI